jgi:GT2 family glycosyltransferase
MSAQHLDVSVVICAHSEARWEVLAKAVASAQAQRTPPREILVVIDHNPALLDRVRESLPGVVAVENDGPRGTSGSRNSGIAAARGAVLAFLDDDAIAAPDWIAELLAGYIDASVLGVGGAIKPLWPGRRPAWFPEEFDWVIGCTYRGMPRDAAPVRNLIGCNMSFRRHIFEAVGGFREGMGRVDAQPFGCEETELCIRLRQHWTYARLRYNPRACVRHHVTAERACWDYFRARCYAEGRSKAQVARLVGAGDGSAAERAYVLRTLPRGILYGLVDAVARPDSGGLARSATILAGLAMTTAGYLRGLLGQAFTWRAAVAPAPRIGADRRDAYKGALL